MSNDNPYTFLFEYSDMSTVKFIISEKFDKYCRYIKDVMKVTLEDFSRVNVGFETDIVDQTNLFCHIRTMPFEKRRPASNTNMNIFGQLSSFSLKPTVYGFNEQNLIGLEFKGKVIFKNDLRYKPTFRNEIENLIANANDKLIQNVVQIKNKSEYIENITSHLINNYKMVKRSDWGALNDMKVFLEIQYIAIFNTILSKLASYLSFTLRRSLNQHLSINTINSFNAKKKLLHPYIIRISSILMDAQLIDNTTPHVAIKNIFSGNIPDDKINWIGGKMALFTFISKIVKSGHLEPTNQQHWAITVNCFLLDGGTINRDELKNGKPITDKKKLQAINNIIVILDPSNY